MQQAERPIRRRRLHSYDNAAIIAYVRDLARRLNKDTLTGQDIREDGEIHPYTIRRKFGSLGHALLEAGVKPRQKSKSDPEWMLRELAEIMQALGREPKQQEINRQLTYNAQRYKRAFGTLAQAFDLAQARLGASSEAVASAEAVLPPQPKPARSRSHYGAPLQFRGMGHAPVNKQGVVLLFGMVAADLGLILDSVRSTFPDFDGKSRRADGTFERVVIACEFTTRAFGSHRHDATPCDIFVCWEHDWPACPRDVRVIELRSVIGKLKS